MFLASLRILGAGDGTDWLAGHFEYVLVGLIVLTGLILGLGDFLRFSPKRVWAIASVGFQESIRRRVLWVTPLAMLGIVAVTQLAHPIDEQDAIRQTTKYALFASGLVVVVATLILACTSLPKEIDNRVIYTIVTKPATRLEIVLGKTIGFARTAGLILLLMGAFSFVYLHINASQLASSVQSRLAVLPASDLSRETLQHYADEGLLGARTYARPDSLQIFAKLPEAGDPYRWVFGNSEQNVWFPVAIPEYVFDKEDTQLVINIQLAIEQRALTRHEVETERLDPGATTRPTTQGTLTFPGPARLTVSLQSSAGYALIPSSELIDARHLAQTPNQSAIPTAQSMVLEPPGDLKPSALVVVGPKAMAKIKAQQTPDADGRRRVYVALLGTSLATRYGYQADSVRVDVQLTDAQGNPVPPKTIPRMAEDGKELQPSFRGRMSTASNQQLRGDSDRNGAPVAVYTFRNASISGSNATVPFEFRTKIERSGSDASEADTISTVEVTVRNRKTNVTTSALNITPDSDRPTFFRAPREAVEGGDFDVQLRSRTDGHFVGLRSSSLAVVASTGSFAYNLVKSLVILWLMSILVVIISVFCSTFVSWPIAVVLTLVILLGRWSVNQLGEPATPQSIFTDLFGANNATQEAVQAKLFTSTLGALNKGMQTTARILPDMDQFRVTEDIERGVTIKGKSLLDAGWVLLTFGIPLLLLAYIFLRQKEVAP